jgi:hypothetical protein
MHDIGLRSSILTNRDYTLVEWMEEAAYLTYEWPTQAGFGGGLAVGHPYVRYVMLSNRQKRKVLMLAK